MSDRSVRIFRTSCLAVGDAAIAQFDGSSARSEGVIEVCVDYGFDYDQQNGKHGKPNLKDFLSLFLRSYRADPPLGCGPSAQNPGTAHDIQREQRACESQSHHGKTNQVRMKTACEPGKADGCSERPKPHSGVDAAESDCDRAGALQQNE